MKKLSLSLLAIVLITIYSCDKREDIFAKNNVAPTLEVSAINTPSSSIDDFTSSTAITDSFKLSYTDYLLDFKIEDESENVELITIIDNNQVIDILNKTTTEGLDSKYITKGTLKFSPSSIGIYTLDILATDPYDLTNRITITINVHNLNVPGEVYVNTSGNIGNHYPAYINQDITDSFKISLTPFILNVKTEDEADNLNTTFSFLVGSGSTITENLSAGTAQALPGQYIFTHQLEMTPLGVGLNAITVTFTDDIGNITNRVVSAYALANKLPVATTPIVNWVVGKKYNISGNNCYDQDANYGGVITGYNFIIEEAVSGFPVHLDTTVTTPSFDYTFPTLPYTYYRVKLRVVDNDGDWSTIKVGSNFGL